MAPVHNFQNRFSYPATDGISPSVSFDVAQTFTDADIEAINPDIGRFANLVRKYSALLTRRTTLEIFNIATRDVDPRIAMFLASSKRREDNLPMFNGLEQVWEVMFADPNRPGPVSGQNRRLLADGIQRVSAILTASILVGQLAQVTEQFEHAQYLEKQGIADLERICATWQISEQSAPATDSNSKESASISFYFEPLDFTIAANQKLVVSWYSPAFSSIWQYVETYVGSVSTWMVVSDLVDSINASMSADSNQSLVAVAALSGPAVLAIDLHTLSFYPRYSQANVVAHSINIRIETQPLTGTPTRTSTTSSPFSWGPYANSIDTFPVNGNIIVTDYGRLSTTALQKEIAVEPIVLYFRNAVQYDGVVPEPPLSSNLKIRTQPWQPGYAIEASEPTETSIPIPRLIGTTPAEQLDLDNNRFSQVALEVLNSLAGAELKTKATGALIRNDPLDATTPMAAIELVAWTLTQAESYVLLDVLEVPPDILIATGDRLRPNTLFSSKPRTIRVKCSQFKSSGSSTTNNGTSLQQDKPYVLKKKSSKVWRDIQEEAATVQDSGWF